MAQARPQAARSLSTALSGTSARDRSSTASASIATTTSCSDATAGVDGIKTGYTRASGFNLVTSLKKDGRHVVAVVMGGRTGRKRNAKMRRLLSAYFPQASTSRTRKPNVRVARLRQRQRVKPKLARATRQVAPRPGADDTAASCGTAAIWAGHQDGKGAPGCIPEQRKATAPDGTTFQDGQHGPGVVPETHCTAAYRRRISPPIVSADPGAATAASSQPSLPTCCRPRPRTGNVEWPGATPCRTPAGSSCCLPLRATGPAPNRRIAQCCG